MIHRTTGRHNSSDDDEDFRSDDDNDSEDDADDYDFENGEEEESLTPNGTRRNTGHDNRPLFTQSLPSTITKERIDNRIRKKLL